MPRVSIIRHIHQATLVLSLFVSTVYSSCDMFNRQTTTTLTLADELLTFKTPGWRISYFSRMDCRWIIDAGSDSATIVFDIKEAMIENSEGCDYDGLAFYQGNTTTTLVQRLCGTRYSGEYISVSGRYAVLQLYSDNSRQYAGADMRIFYATDKSSGSCSGTPAAITATTTMDYITSPGYPVSLENGVACSWTITCQATTVLYLEIVYSDMDNADTFCLDQVLSIYDGTSTSDPALLVSWCDSRDMYPSQQTIYYTTGNKAHVTLITSPESFAEKHGFRLKFKQNSAAVTTTPSTTTVTTQELVQVCSTSPVSLTASSTWKYFNSINYPEYYVNNLECKWTITAPVGYAINLTIVDAFIQDGEECSYRDSVVVYDGSSSSHPHLKTFCGEEKPVLVSTGRYLHVRFHTDPTITFRGFSAMYQTIAKEVPSCAVASLVGNFTATETAQTFISPGYPTEYNDSMTLYWMISNPNETQALIIEVLDSRIEASVGCQFDNVTIFQGPCTTYPWLGQFCGSSRPSYVYKTGAYALISLNTDSTAHYRGFNISFYLTDHSDSTDYSKYIIGGIIAGVLVSAAVLAIVSSLGIYKYRQHRKNKVASRASSRCSSISSCDSSSHQHSSNNLPPIQRPLPPISEDVYS